METWVSLPKMDCEDGEVIKCPDKPPRLPSGVRKTRASYRREMFMAVAHQRESPFMKMESWRIALEGMSLVANLPEMYCLDTTLKLKALESPYPSGISSSPVTLRKILPVLILRVPAELMA